MSTVFDLVFLFSHVCHSESSPLPGEGLRSNACTLIDYKTDAFIQSSLRTALKPDMTLLTIAHRLQTVMDFDKIVRPRRYSARVQEALNAAV